MNRNLMVSEDNVEAIKVMLRRIGTIHVIHISFVFLDLLFSAFVKLIHATCLTAVLYHLNFPSASPGVDVVVGNHLYRTSVIFFDFRPSASGLKSRLVKNTEGMLPSL